MSGSGRAPDYQDTVDAMFNLLLAAGKVDGSSEDVVFTDPNVCLDIIALLITNYIWTDGEEERLKVIEDIGLRVSHYLQSTPLRSVPINTQSLI